MLHPPDAIRLEGPFKQAKETACSALLCAVCPLSRVFPAQRGAGERLTVLIQAGEHPLGPKRRGGPRLRGCEPA